MSKACRTCSMVKPYEAFYRKPRYEQYPNSAAGRSHECKLCANAKRKAYREHNREVCDVSDRNSRLKRTYGITLEQYNEMFNAQNGCCAGCKKHQSEMTNRLSVDHDHVTGQVRGLLCTPCNLTLGYVQDNQAILDNLKEYLNKFSELAVKSNVVVFKSSTKAG